MEKGRKESALCAALVLSAGRGNRFGAEIPKQYIKINGRTALTRSINILNSHPRIDAVKVVIHPDDIEFYNESIKGLNVLDPTFGGEERHNSVLLGLESLKPLNPKYVLIHDAVRPNIQPNLIDSLYDALSEGYDSVLPAIMVKDSVKRVANNLVIGSVDRNQLWQAQTPQAFDFYKILQAHHENGGNFVSDDSEIAEKNNIPTKVVEGSIKNIKLTSAKDLIELENSLNIEASKNSPRVGFGYDVHKFGPGTSLKLCGVKIPFNKSLLGHSDADVAVHALTDAMLGAIGLGDIGLHFPESDPKWKGTDSKQFLEHANETLRAQGGSIINIDLTIICEKPKIAGYRIEMQNSLADVLKISPEIINIKATTTEKLGFLGRGEGLATQAAVLINL